MKENLTNTAHQLPVIAKILKSVVKRDYYLRKKETEYQYLFKMVRDVFNKSLPDKVKMTKHNPPNNKIAVECYEFTPEGYYSPNLSQKERREKYPTCFFFHGGGFMYCAPHQAYKCFLGTWARKLNVRIFAPNYRKSPEFKSPACYEDCFNWTTHILENAGAGDYNVDLNNFSIMGDSAGAMITLSVLVKLFEQKKHNFRPKLVVPICASTFGAYFDLPSHHSIECNNSMPVERAAEFCLNLQVGMDFNHGIAELPETETTMTQEQIELVKGGLIKGHALNFFNRSADTDPDNNEVDPDCFDIEKYLSKESNDFLKQKTKRTEILSDKEMREYYGDKIYTNFKKVCREGIVFHSCAFMVDRKTLKEFVNFYNDSKTKFFFIAAEYDLLRDESLIFANRMLDLNANVTVNLAKSMGHDFPFFSTVLGGFVPLVDETVLEMMDDIRAELERSN